jgi:tetratricopeptide (TPR) repeat protein
LRQAATAGYVPAAELLADYLTGGSHRQDEIADTLLTTDRQSAMSGHGHFLPNPGDQAFDGSYWQRRKRQLEAHYWERVVTLTREGKNPWASDDQYVSDEAAPDTPQIYQAAPPLEGNDLAAARQLAARGDWVGAREAYERVIATNHPFAAPEAASDLAKMLFDAGDLARASELLRKVTRSCHLQAGPWAACNLGHVLASSGDTEGAIAALERAIYSRSSGRGTNGRDQPRAPALSSRSAVPRHRCLHGGCDLGPSHLQPVGSLPSGESLRARRRRSPGASCLPASPPLPPE